MQRGERVAQVLEWNVRQPELCPGPPPMSPHPVGIEWASPLVREHELRVVPFATCTQPRSHLLAPVVNECVSGGGWQGDGVRRLRGLWGAERPTVLGPDLRLFDL